MFWNATFAHSQTLKYPENLRYGRLFFSAIGLSGCTFRSITCLLFPFAGQFFRLPKKKCHLLCQAGKTSRYDNIHSLFQSNLKRACCWLVRDGPLCFWEVSLGNFLTFRLCMMFFLVINSLWKNFFKVKHRTWILQNTCFFYHGSHGEIAPPPPPQKKNGSSLNRLLMPIVSYSEHVCYKPQLDKSRLEVSRWVLFHSWSMFIYLFFLRSRSKKHS